MRSCQVDTSRWPIVVYSLDEGATDADVDAFIAEADAVAARRERWVAILDASGIGRVSPRVRARAIHWQKANRATLETFCVGTAFILTSPLMRFILMTVLLITDLPTPWRVCASLDEALAWAEEQRARIATP